MDSTTAAILAVAVIVTLYSLCYFLCSTAKIGDEHQQSMSVAFAPRSRASSKLAVKDRTEAFAIWRFKDVFVSQVPTVRKFYCVQTEHEATLMPGDVIVGYRNTQTYLEQYDFNRMRSQGEIVRDQSRDTADLHAYKMKESRVVTPTEVRGKWLVLGGRHGAMALSSDCVEALIQTGWTTQELDSRPEYSKLPRAAHQPASVS